jgi:hypothetical protein
MSQSSPIADYIDALARELRFDTALLRRVQAEVEDHLWEAATDQSDVSSHEAQRRAIAGFGDPRELACQYAATALLAQVRRVSTVMVLCVIGTFAAMKGRVAWYDLMQWEWNQNLKMASAVGLSVDRYAFMLAVGFALIGAGYIVTRKAPVEFHLGYGKQLNRCIMLCGAAAGALVLSVATETVLTGIRLFGTALSAAALVPALSLAAEIAAAGVLVFHIRTTIRRSAVASSLMRR